MQKSSRYSLRGHRRQGFKLPAGPPAGAIGVLPGQQRMERVSTSSSQEMPPQKQGLWSVPSITYFSQEVRLTSVLKELIPELI